MVREQPAGAIVRLHAKAPTVEALHSTIESYTERYPRWGYDTFFRDIRQTDDGQWVADGSRSSSCN